MANPLELLSSEGLDAATPVAGLTLLQPPPGPFKAGFGAGVAGVKSNVAGAGALAAHAVGAVDAEQAALDYAAQQSEAAAAGSRKIEDVDWTSPSSIADHAKYLLGNAIPSLAMMFAGGVVGRGLGAVAGRAAPGAAAILERSGTLAGAVAPDVALEAGGIYPEALTNHVENPALRAAAGGAAAAALDFVPLLAAERYLKAAGRGGFGAVARGAAKGAPVGAALEGTQELLQSIVENAAAGEDLTSPKAVSDYINSFAGGALPGAVIGAGIGGHRASSAPAVAAPAVAPAPAVAVPAAAPAAEVPVAAPTEAEQHATAVQLAAQTEAQIAQVQAAQVQAASTLAALKAEEAKPLGERRPRNEIIAERRAVTAGVTKSKTTIEALGGQLHTARTAAAALAHAAAPRTTLTLESPPLSLPEADITAPEPHVPTAQTGERGTVQPDGSILPKEGTVIPKGSMIADPNAPAPTPQEQTDAAVKGVHAIFREQGMPLATTAESLATPAQTPREVALEVVQQRAPRETLTAPGPTSHVEVEDRAMAVIEPMARELATAKGRTPGAATKIAARLASVMRDVVQDASKLPTIAEAKAHIVAHIPSALKGKGVAKDAADIAKAVAAAVGVAAHEGQMIAAGVFHAAQTAAASAANRATAAKDTGQFYMNEAWASLTRVEQTAVETEVGRAPFELAVTSWMEGKRGQVNAWLKTVSETVQAAFKKIIAILLSLTVALHVAHVEDAKAMPLPDRQTTVRMKTVIAKPKAFFGATQHSSMTEVVANWVVATNAHDGKAFVLADKADGKIYAFSDKGDVIADAPALYGEVMKDDVTPGQLSKPLAEMTKADKITPAGKWKVALQKDAEYGWTLDLVGGHGLAIHSVYLGTPSENRAARLASATPSDNFISWGCINVPAEFATNVMEPHFKDGEHGLFILPVQSENTLKTFGIMEADLMPTVAVSSSTSTTPDQGAKGTATQGGAVDRRGAANARGRRTLYSKAAPSPASNAAITQDQFEALPADGQERVVDTYNDLMRQRGLALRERITELLGDDPGLRVKTFQANPDSPIGLYTRIDKLKSVIALALNAKDALSIADHEGFHYAEDRLLNSSERAVIRLTLAPGKPLFEKLMSQVRAYDATNNTHVADEVAATPAEAHAYAFEFWRRGELQPEGLIAKVFEKIRQVMERIVNLIHGLGFQSMEDIFTALDRGQYAERTRGEGSPGTFAARGAGEIRTIEVAGVRRPVEDSQGHLVAQTFADQTAFWKWFGDSKVVDEHGRPLVVYHGTGSDFATFSMAGRKYLNGLQTAGAAWFTPNTERASWSAESLPKMRGEKDAAPSVYPVYLALKNPLVLKSSELSGGTFHGMGSSYPNVADRVRIIESGFDGVVISETGKAVGASEILAFNPEQIKSAIGNRGTFDATNPDIRYSRAAAAATMEQDRRAQAGEDVQAQMNQTTAKMMEDAMQHGSDNLAKVAFGAVQTEAAGGIARWWQKNIATPNFISRFSNGYKNVFKVLNTYVRYRNDLVERMLVQKIPLWYKASSNDQDAAFKALNKRNVEGYTRDSVQLRELMATLSEKQREMFVSATRMFEGFLTAEFAADQPFYRRVLVTPGEYEKWFAQRQTQVDSLIDQGYMPLRRYGDHTVHVYINATKPDGTPYKQSAALQFFGSAAVAHKAAKVYEEEIARTGSTMQVEVGTHYKAERDTSISPQQFLDTARRNGVALTSLEQERLVKALSSGDSLIRNRMLHREGLPGYSQDGMRVINEFGMRMAGKLAYAKFASAIDAATTGRAVDADVVAGQAQITVDSLRDGESAQDFDSRNLWKIEGPMSGFHHNLADELTDYVLVPDHTGEWSRKLRGAAMMYFIGGSISAALVNTTSVPMMVVPELSIHTDYTTAAATTLSAWKTAWRYQHILRDIERLKSADPADAVPGIDAGLRQALVEAAQYTLDTELHQIMGISQGQLFSQNQGVQRAMKAWMSPFQVSEQTNRITSFIAGYRVGQKNGLTGPALFKFARDMIDATQNNYNETNRPGAARNPIFALMFMFKSFPLFMTEAAVLMYKANPKSAIYMLLGLTAMTGVQGLPFAEAIEDLIDTIAQQIFGSPFNTRRAMRNAIKSASDALVGYDLSDIVLRGVINSTLGISASSRIGAGDFVPGSRLGTADADQGKVLEQLLGAPYAMVKESLGHLSNLAGGALSLDWKQTADALRAGGPIAVRNAIKGVEQLTDGYASDSKGRVLTDVSGMDAMLQLTGLSSAKLAKIYELEKINVQTKAFYTHVSSDMQNQLVQAIRANDAEKVQEINDLRAAWNAQYPEMPIMANASSVRRDIALAGIPMDRRSQLLWARRIRGENVFADNPP